MLADLPGGRLSHVDVRQLRSMRRRDPVFADPRCVQHDVPLSVPYHRPPRHRSQKLGQVPLSRRRHRRPQSWHRRWRAVQGNRLERRADWGGAARHREPPAGSKAMFGRIATTEEACAPTRLVAHDSSMTRRLRPDRSPRAAPTAVDHQRAGCLPTRADVLKPTTAVTGERGGPRKRTYPAEVLSTAMGGKPTSAAACPMASSRPPRPLRQCWPLLGSGH